MRFRGQWPDPAHFWIRFSPKPWPGRDGFWLDLAAGSLGRREAGAGEDLTAGVGSGGEGLGALDDLVYLPSLDQTLRPQGDRLAAALAERGVPVVAQVSAGEEVLSPATLVVHDLTEILLSGDLDRLVGLPPGGVAVWPLINGLTDQAELVEAGLDALARAGASCVRGASPELSPADCRRLTDLAGEEAFEGLFHGPAPDERDFARRAWRRGLRPFLDRPLPDGWGPGVENRRLAGLLALVAELALRTGWAESRGQTFFRAARLVDREPHDLTTLAREGNLGVVTWLDEESRGVIEDYVRQGRSPLRERLEREYLE